MGSRRDRSPRSSEDRSSCAVVFFFRGVHLLIQATAANDHPPSLGLRCLTFTSPDRASVAAPAWSSCSPVSPSRTPSFTPQGADQTTAPSRVVISGPPSRGGPPSVPILGTERTSQPQRSATGVSTAPVKDEISAPIMERGIYRRRFSTLASVAEETLNQGSRVPGCLVPYPRRVATLTPGPRATTRSRPRPRPGCTITVVGVWWDTAPGRPSPIGRAEFAAAPVIGRPGRVPVSRVLSA
jgi:hypothetical protein